MKVGIIGGGITGLTTALALRKRGIEAVVYEQAASLNEIGAGIWVQPNAMKVLDWLGIREQVMTCGIELHRVGITDAQLQPLRKLKGDLVEDAEGSKILAIHRAKLQRVLFEAAERSCEIYLNKQYLRHEVHPDGITIHFAEGEAEVDILLGADGINSAVRASIMPDAPLRNAGQICWRGVAKMPLPEALKNLGQEAWGSHRRFGFSQIGEETVYWFAVVDDTVVVGGNTRPKTESLMKLFGGFSPVVREIIGHTEAAQIHQATLHDLKRLPRWFDNKICLLGDAAHATTPNMGQGACQGMEDAYFVSQYLAECLPDARLAFQRFEERRRRKVDYVVNTSWRFGKLAHSFFGQQLLKAIIKLTPERTMRAQMGSLYHLD
ncbi:FAD-dependent monooxygenase [Lewinella sp. W8]|uniref:FAD-dependent monooxygenase n=1 Tax=Lewinella sp. W8 TaxID=2528208 RepID=UPI00106730B6|nr:FAD-dependent monooxygenase [Lewinella sp. W8]MTB52362.1 NAD(P)-binding protein [Lewinella sp. W8]